MSEQQVRQKSFAIEVAGRSAGIVVADRDGYTFHAADWAFKALNRRRFAAPAHAERAVRRVMSDLLQGAA